MYISSKRDCLGTESAERCEGDNNPVCSQRLEHVLKDLIMAGHAKSFILHATARGVTDKSLATGPQQDSFDDRLMHDLYEPAQCILCENG